MREENDLRVNCPSFDEGLKMCSDYQMTTGLSSKDYAVPIDKGIIKVLDNPLIQSVFNTTIGAAVDLEQSSIISSGFPVNETNFPEINDIVNHCVSVLNIKRPYVVVTNSVGYNAYTTGCGGEEYIVLGSMLVHTMSPDMMRFVIGHECGHIAMGHVLYHTVIRMSTTFSQYIPIIGKAVYSTTQYALLAWSRRSEITADRAGLLCCNDLEVAQKALLKIQAGFINIDNLDVDDYLDNFDKYRNARILRKIGEFSSSHPMIAKRLKAMRLFANSDVYYSVRGLAAPVGSMQREDLNHSIEKLVAVMGV